MLQYSILTSSSKVKFMCSIKDHILSNLNKLILFHNKKAPKNLLHRSSKSVVVTDSRTDGPKNIVYGTVD